MCNSTAHHSVCDIELSRREPGTLRQIGHQKREGSSLREGVQYIAIIMMTTIVSILATRFDYSNCRIITCGVFFSLHSQFLKVPLTVTMNANHTDEDHLEEDENNSSKECVMDFITRSNDSDLYPSGMCRGCPTRVLDCWCCNCDQYYCDKCFPQYHQTAEELHHSKVVVTGKYPICSIQLSLFKQYRLTSSICTGSGGTVIAKPLWSRDFYTMVKQERDALLQRTRSDDKKREYNKEIERLTETQADE